MKRSVFWFIVICATLSALLLWYGEKRSKAPQSIIADTNIAPPSPQDRAVTIARQQSPRTNAPGAITSSNAPTSTTPKAEQMKEGLAAFNNEDIVLYGRVMDQFGSPVENAAIGGSTEVNNGTRLGGDKISLTTDSSGFFTISGYKGKALGIHVVKQGYVMATTNTRFVYSQLWPSAERYKPDPNNPTVIKMWKLQGAEPLASINKEYRLPFVSTPLSFDLAGNSVSDNGGDLQVIITRASGPLSKRNPGDWSIELIPVNGGILETSDDTSRVTYQAPTEGYQNTYSLQMNHDNAAWFDNIQKVFFLTSQGGRVYSKFSLDFAINDDPNGSMWFQFKGVANTNSSPNWEASAAQTQ